MNQVDIFPWNANFDTGIAAIDEQHRTLARLINRLANHVTFDVGLPVLDEVFDELAHYAVHHFQTEEAIWRGELAEDALTRSHTRTHEGFVDKVTTLRNSSGGQQADGLVDEVLAFLCQWLVTHIVETDRFMALVVFGRRSGLTVERAIANAREQMEGSHKVLVDILLSVYGVLSSNTLALMRQLRERRAAEARLAESEQALRQSQKMEAVGQLAGGIAHDFNNVLSIILACAELATEKAQPGSLPTPELREIRSAAQRGADLTRRLLSFTRRQVMQARVVNLNQVLLAMETLLGRLLTADVVLKTSCAEELWPVYVDPTQVEQVVMNLVVNARDAMPEGGTLSIATANVELAAVHPSSDPPLPPGPYVTLTVRDDGVGMDDDTRRRMFEPFFTTKAPGKGTGLGLAVVHAAVKQGGGAIEVESSPGRGTTFRLFFPRTLRKQPAPIAEPSRVSIAGGNETILLAEDDAPLRQLMGAALRRAGYAVLDAANPREVLQASATRTEPIHLLISDVILPEIDGVQLADRLVSLRPGLKVLFVSGYTGEFLANRGFPADSAFFPKPFSLDQLLHKVRHVLDSVASPIN